MTFYSCPQCNQIFFRDSDQNQAFCNSCRHQALDSIQGRFILRCRKCGLTQTKNAMKVMGGQNPLHCQSPTCNGPIKVIFLGGRQQNYSQKIKDQKSPPKPHQHPNLPQKRSLPSAASRLSEALANKKPLTVNQKSFSPFPGQTAKIPFKGSPGHKKDHPGLKLGDCLELDGSLYEITGGLGTGGMSAVWKGRHVDTNKPIAIKEFYYTRFHDPETGNNYCEKYWNRETKISELQSKSPEKCMRYHGRLKIDDFDVPEYFIFLEYIEGQMLDAWYNERFPKVEKITQKDLQVMITEILMPITRHMYYVHSIGWKEGKGIVHRDLTVQNIMICQNDMNDKLHPIIIDWGVAKEVTPMYNPRKPYYIAATPEATGIRNRGTPPEVMAGFEPIAATDIYMLGHIMFYLFSGGHYASSAATNEDFVLHPSDFNPDLPPDFNRLVEYMTQYEPADRMESMVKVYDALEWLLNSIKTKDAPPDEITQQRYFLYCDYNQAMIPLPEGQIITLGRDEIISPGVNHEMDGHLFNALIPMEQGKFSFEIYLENNYAYVRDKYSKLGTYISNLTATNQQIYNDIPIKGLDNACIQLSEQNIGKTTIEVPFVAPDGITYRIQFMIVKH